MILARNEKYSLHKLEPDTYSHETFVLVEKVFKFMDYEYIERATALAELGIIKQAPLV